jgi:hypothetical protein
MLYGMYTQDSYVMRRLAAEAGSTDPAAIARVEEKYVQAAR